MKTLLKIILGIVIFLSAIIVVLLIFENINMDWGIQ